MIKVALIAAMVLAASVAEGGGEVAEAPPVPAAPACHAARSPDTDCALRILDADGDGIVSPAELAAGASPGSPPAIDWAPLPPPAIGLDFKDAATDPGLGRPVALDHPGPPTLLSALLALAALVMLLRKRPT